MVSTTLSPLEGRYRRATEMLRKDTAAISPIETIYKNLTEGLREAIGEKALSRSRIMVEGEYLIFLSKQNLGTRQLSREETDLIRALYNVTDSDVDALKAMSSGAGRGYRPPTMT